MATFTWYIQGSSPTTIDATDLIQFAGASGFDDPIQVGEYNDTTHVKTAASANKSSGNTPNNNKFISQAGGTGGDSQADWGGGTEDIDQILDAECALKINFADAASVAISGAILYAYDGATPATAPTDVDVRMAESGDANFTQAEGSAAALSLADQGAGTSHDYFVIVSMSPESVTTKTGTIRMELTYS